MTQYVRRKLTWRKMIIGVLVILCLAGVRGWLAWDYQSELAALREAGYPTDPHELAEWREPRNPEGTRLYERALPEFDEPPEDWPYEDDETLEKPRPGEPLREREKRWMRTHVERHAVGLQLLHEAAEAGGGTPPWWSEPIDLEPEEPLRQVRGAIVAATIEATLAAEAGDAEAALRSLETASYVPAMINDDVMFTPLLVHHGAAIEWMAAAERVLGWIELNEPALDRIERALQRTKAPAGAFERALYGQQAIHLHLWDAVVAEFDSAGERFAYKLFSAVFGHYELENLQYIQETKRLAEGLRLDSEPDQRAHFRAVADEEPSALFFMQMLRGESVYRTLTSHHKYRAYHRVTRTALAVARFYLAEERLPDDLDELTPTYLDAVPLDPFTGDPLIYKVLDDGFVVYSVGDNLEDSGGDDSYEAVEAHRDDIAFRMRLGESEED